MDEPRRGARVSDAERAAVDERLKQAHVQGRLSLDELGERSGRCWQARTVGELADVVADLPEQAIPAQMTADHPQTSSRDWGGLAKKAVGVGAVAVAAGWFVVPTVAADDGFSLFSSRVVQASSSDDRVEVGTMFGSVTVVVPADARVTTEGTLIFGSVECQDACDGSGTRDVVVDANGAFGSVDIQRAAGAGADG